MAEVPEHLLRRSKERRAALGLGPSETDQTPGPASRAEPSASQAGPTNPASQVPAVAAPAGVMAPGGAVDSGGAKANLDAVAARHSALTRNRIPIWVALLLASIPVWAFFYAGAFSEEGTAGPVDPIQLGGQLFVSKGCSGCHGSAGEGNPVIGAPKLAGGETKLTFPNEADHIAWVTGGSLGSSDHNVPYGDPARVGGQHISKGGMPAFGTSLSKSEIEAVVKYEREKL